MGYVHTQIGLRNPRREELREVEVRALVDTGSNHLCLPRDIVAELGLETNSTRSVKTADGSIHECHYVGPVRVRFQNRECFVGALELGDTVLLGAIPMEDMDLVINPMHQTVTVNPDFPDAPHALAMDVSELAVM
jgi:clan AA aspartic protease